MALLTKTAIYLYALSLAVDDKTGQSVQVAYKIATDFIHENGYPLPDFALKLVFQDSPLDQQGDDLLHASKIGPLYDTCSPFKEFITSPVNAGPTWSGSASQASIVFEGWNMLHISSCSTSTDLTAKPSLFRTIGTDKEQAKVLLELADHYNWKRIGFIHLDGYKDWLTKAAKEFDSDIEVISMSYENNNESISDAAKLIVENELYVTILYVRGDNLLQLFTELEALGAATYPYYYVATDISWFDQGFVTKNNLWPYINNLLGIVPGTPKMFDITTFEKKSPDDENSTDIWHVSSKYVEYITNAWNDLYDSKKLIFPGDIKNIYVEYAFDSVLAIAMALDEYNKQYGLIETVGGCYDTNITKYRMKKILTNTQFNGATGWVSFDENGDRKDPIWAILNVVDGQFVTVGGLIGDTFFINDSIIKWPFTFTEKGIVPKSDYDYDLLILVIASFVIALIVGICVWFAMRYEIHIFKKRRWGDAKSEQSKGSNEQSDSSLDSESSDDTKYSHVDSQQHCIP